MTNSPWRRRIGVIASQVQRTLVYIFAAVAILYLLMSLLGFDWLLLLIGACGTAPLAIVLCVLSIVPGPPISGGRRCLGIVLPLIVLSVAWTGWPFRISFLLHRPAMETLSRQILEGTVDEGPRRVGLLDFQGIHQHKGCVGFQYTGGDGGGMFVVHRGRNDIARWLNPNWTVDLGDGWIWTEQD